MRRRIVVGVVVGMVLIVGALLLTSVCKVREAAARTICTNHQKQILLAMHDYASTFQEQRHGKTDAVFPAGTVALADVPPERRLSWCVQILPFIESSPLYSQFDPAAPVDSAKNRAAGDSILSLYVCSSSPDADRDRRATAPVLYYPGVAGDGPDAPMLPPGDPRAGIFGYDRRTAFSDITDGTSNTMALLEITDNAGRWAVGGPGTVRGLDPADAPYVGLGRPFGGLHAIEQNWYGAARRTAAVAGMADGSVRTLKEGTATAIIEALATIAGKEELPAAWE
jgi:hypothetical protein